MPRMTLDLSDEIDQALTDIAKQSGITKAEAMRRAFALLAVAYAEKKKPGFSLGIVREMPDHTLEAVCRVVGISLAWTVAQVKISTCPRYLPNQRGVSINEGECLHFAVVNLRPAVSFPPGCCFVRTSALACG